MGLVQPPTRKSISSIFKCLCWFILLNRLSDVLWIEVVKIGGTWRWMSTKPKHYLCIVITITILFFVVFLMMLISGYYLYHRFLYYYGFCIIIIYVLWLSDYDDVQFFQAFNYQCSNRKVVDLCFVAFPEVKRSEGAQLVVLNFGHGWMLHDGWTYTYIVSHEKSMSIPWAVD